MLDHEYYMDLALKEAQKAGELGEIPVGALVVAGSDILAKTHNQNESLGDVTAHAEILAITAASQALGSKYLNHCTLYVSLEPCVMCAGALYWAQLGTLVFGAWDQKRGYHLYEKKEGKAVGLIHPRTQVIGGIREAESQEILWEFFRKMRN
ncbi:MAG: nucleoside deaminase [Bacteroidota bacterium]